MRLRIWLAFASLMVGNLIVGSLMFAKPQAKKQTFVIVPGAWQGAWAWEEVEKGLIKEGHKVFVIDLPAHGNDSSSIASASLDSYVKHVIKHINQAKEKVILVGHSMGGVVVTAVATSVPDQIEKLVYVAAYVPGDAQSLNDLAQTDRGSVLGKKGNLIFAKDYSTIDVHESARANAFCQDCNAAAKKLLLTRYRTEPLAPLQEKIKIKGTQFEVLPKLYIHTTKDQAVSSYLQLKMIGHHRFDDVVAIDSSHSPFLSRSSDLVRILTVNGDSVAH